MNSQKKHGSIYDKLSTTFKVNFRAQIKDSPFEFENLFYIQDLVTEEKFYLLEFYKNNEALRFKDRESFISKFLLYTQLKLRKLNNDYEDLLDHENNLASSGVKYDENDIYMQHEVIGHRITKLTQLEKKLTSLSSK